MSQRSFLTNIARQNLETLNLRRFFGDYRAFSFDPESFHLGIGEIAQITDDATWQGIIHSFYADPRLVSRATMYSGTRGERDANQAMADHVGGMLGRPELGEQHVVPYDGGHNAISGIVRACAAPLGSARDERQYVLVPTPCYPYFPTIVTAHTGVMAYTAYSAEEMVSSIETLVNPQVGVVMINVPHNPTGYVLSAEQVARINHAVAPYDCVLAVDMVYGLHALEPQAIKALGGLDSDRTIYIDSFSKKFGLPGYRLGFALCANTELIEALRMLKAAESISTSNVKLLFAAHLLERHMGLAEATAQEIRRRHEVFRAGLEGIEEYGIEVPPLSLSANAFYLPLYVERLLDRTGLSADEFVERCYEKYGVVIVTGTRMYPPADLPEGELTMDNGTARVSTPGPVVYAPGFAEAKRPFVRVSFGVEHRVSEAAERFMQACAETFVL